MLNKKYKKSTRQIKDERFGFLMSLPSMILLGLLFIFPIIYSFGASFTNYRLVQGDLKFIGFENYISMFKNKDLWQSLL